MSRYIVVSGIDYFLPANNTLTNTHFMQKQIITVPNGIKFLSQVIDNVPDQCILNKGITGCGGTTVEINSQRNSIIIVPIVNLIKSKQVSTNIFGVYGDIKNPQIKEYISSFKGYKKIMATYDALPRLIEIIGESIFEDYFLLIDEYHTFTDYYSFRRNAIRGVLNNYHKFKHFCFMTATPIKDDYMLKELEHLDVIEYNWEGSSRVNITIKDTPYVQKELLSEIGIAKDYNLHIFVNSVDFIKRIVPNLPSKDFRTVCSAESATKTPQIQPQDINSPVCKINFYTSAAFEGCDIMDENGYVIIIADSNIATTIKDISTSVVQICGRIRNSKYKTSAYMILNTKNHRYCKFRSKDLFLEFTEQIKSGAIDKVRSYEIGSINQKRIERELFLKSQGDHHSLYMDFEDNTLFYDDNYRKLDIRNYILINEIYNKTINVLSEIQSTNQLQVKKVEVVKYDKATMEMIDLLDRKLIYNYSQIKEILLPVFEKYNLSTTDNKIGRYLTTFCDKNRLQVNGKREWNYQLKV